MTEETRTEKALRRVNEQLKAERDALDSMSLAQKHAVWILVVAVAAVVAFFMWVF